MKDWGFRLTDIDVPVLLWQGRQDLMVPFAHGEWLAENIPNVEAQLSDDDGHLTLVVQRVGEIEEMTPSAVKVTVTYDDFEPDSEMLNGVREGWVGILSNLKSLLETGWTVSEEGPPQAAASPLA